MNGKIKVEKGNKFIKKLQTDMDYLKHDPEWRTKYMNLQMKLQDVREEGIEKGIKKGIKEEQRNSINFVVSTLKDLKVNDNEILAKLKQKYGKYFSDEELRKFLK